MENTPVRMPNLSKRIVHYSQSLDSFRRYLTDSPTPAAFASLLKQVDQGDLAAMVELNEEMEAKDAHLQDVASRRRESLTALDWSIEPPTKTKFEKAAKESAEFVQGELDELRTFPDTLGHLTDAIGPGIAVTELIWRAGRLVDTIDVPGHRLVNADAEGSPILVETDNQPTGMTLHYPKFIVYTPSSRAGFVVRVTITRAQAYLWVIKHYAIADWTSFAEKYGTPTTVATIKGPATADEKNTVQSMLENIGSDAWGIFSDAIDIKFIEAARSNQPFEGMVDWVERKQSILYLGQTLTTEQGQPGSLALGRVHDNVRASITLSDIEKERRMMREQVIRPMVRFRWPQVEMPLPNFRRRIFEPKMLDEERLALDKLRFMKEMNLPVDKDYVYETLGIPQPKLQGAS